MERSNYVLWNPPTDLLEYFEFLDNLRDEGEINDRV